MNVRCIQPGKVYWVEVDEVQLKLRTIKPASLAGWWLCEAVNGDQVIVRAQHLIERKNAEPES